MSTNIKYVALANVRWNDTPSDKLIPCASNSEVICIRADGIDTMTPGEQAAFIFGWLSRDREHYKQYPVEIKFALYKTCGNTVDATLTDTPSAFIDPEEQDTTPAEVNEQPASVAEKEHNNNASCFGLLEEPQEEVEQTAMLPSLTSATSELLTVREISHLTGVSYTTAGRRIHRARLEPAMVIRGKRLFDSKKVLDVFNTNPHSLLVETKLNPAKQPEAFIDFMSMVREHKITRNTLENLIAMGLPGMMAYKKVTPQVFDEVDSPPYKYIFEKEAYYKLYNEYINNEL